MTVISESAAGLWCASGDFHIDPVLPVERALITHAHGDHALPGSAAYLCAEPSLLLLRRRLGAEARLEGLAYGERRRVGSAEVSFHPAGHVLGSAQVRVEVAGEVWVVSGDYKRDPDPTCAPFEPLRCHAFCTEATYALPIFRWDAPAAVARELFGWWSAGRAEGRASVLFAYAPGKAQRVLAELAQLTDAEVYVHGSIKPLVALYRDAGVRMLPTRLVIDEAKGRDFAGALVLAPPSARGTAWMRRLGARQEAFASGLMRIRGVRRRRAFDRGFVLSDHADWPSLVRTVRETGAERIFTMHGHRQPLARYLREQGLDAQPFAAGLGAEGE